MLKRDYEGQNCSIARALEVVGERWTLLIVRDAFAGLRRFEEFQESLGIARNVLAERLSRLVAEGVLERVRYSERPERYEYCSPARPATSTSRSPASCSGVTGMQMRSRPRSFAAELTRRGSSPPWCHKAPPRSVQTRSSWCQGLCHCVPPEAMQAIDRHVVWSLRTEPLGNKGSVGRNP